MNDLRAYPISIGALVGLISGLLGMGLVPPWGAMVGAVGGGATAAYLSDQGLRGDVSNAVVADVLSSTVFFPLVLAGYLGYVWYDEGLAAISAAWFTAIYVAFGLPLAISVGIVSLAVAAVAGTATSLAKRNVGG